MTDTGFNAHELLSRMRAGAGSNFTNGSVNGGSLSGSVYGNSAVNNSVNYNSNPGAAAPSMSTTQQSSRKPESNINSATGLFLHTQVTHDAIKEEALPKPNPEASIQRREHMEIRAELEREIKRLQDQVSELKAENKQLKSSYAELETKYNTSKQKSHDIIASLRGKLVKPDSLKTTSATPKSAIATSGPKLGPTRKPPSPAINKRIHVVPPPESDDSGEEHLLSRTGTDDANGGFAGPTFSEIMRRTTPAAVDFQEALRKPHLSSGFTHSGARSNQYPNQRIVGASSGESGGHYPNPATGGMEMNELDGPTQMYPYQPHYPLANPSGSYTPSAHLPSHAQVPFMYHQQPPQPPHQYAPPYPYGSEGVGAYVGPSPIAPNPMQRSWETYRRAPMAGFGQAVSMTSTELEDEREDADDLPVLEIDLR